MEIDTESVALAWVMGSRTAVNELQASGWLLFWLSVFGKERLHGEQAFTEVDWHA